MARGIHVLVVLSLASLLASETVWRAGVDMERKSILLLVSFGPLLSLSSRLVE